MVCAVLRTGVTLAAFFIVIGGGVYLWHHGQELPAYHTFRGEPSELRSMCSVARSALELKGSGLIQLGCLILLFTPVLGIVVSLVGFLRKRDWTYIVVTLVLLGLLGFSLLGA